MTQKAAQSSRRIARGVCARLRAVRADPERGDVIGSTIMIPLSLTLFLTAVQVAMWYQARNMCHAAADAGTTAGRVLNATPGTGRTAATDYLATTADRTVHAAAVTETLTRTSITISCHASAFTLLPLPGLTSVDQSATAPRERFTTPGSP